jgi:hypothetical protein
MLPHRLGQRSREALLKLRIALVCGWALAAAACGIVERSIVVVENDASVAGGTGGAWNTGGGAGTGGSFYTGGGPGTGGTTDASALCRNGHRDNGESDIDCGGPTCPKCALGQLCGSPGDCMSLNCVGNLCTSTNPQCSDGIQNGDESAIDCGGASCARCGPGLHCNAPTDCQSGICMGSFCKDPICTDGVKNGNETDIDCGGGMCQPCTLGKHCQQSSDCASTYCDPTFFCATPGGTGSCTDGMKNGTETDTDCGGTTCWGCTIGQHCVANGDCWSKVCSATTNTCVVGPTCTNGVKDGTETDTDCGGGACNLCSPGKTCTKPSDCTTRICNGNICGGTGGCSIDGIRNGTETDIDCGGGACPTCTTGKKCLVPTDCGTMPCMGGICGGTGTCSMNGIQDGAETDTDCGGGACPTCATGKHCKYPSDCMIAMCTAGTCGSGATCNTNGIKDGSETDIDCGGGCATRCMNGKACLTGTDCMNGTCSGGKCQNASCTNGILDPNETDIDCGSNCSPCANGKHCMSMSDCQSGICDTMSGQWTCTPPPCNDGTKNYKETDIDCGGGACPKCAAGKSCSIASDCLGNVCDGTSKCQGSGTCANAIKDGDETGVDCGGSCNGCANGKGCAVAHDCTSGICTANICQSSCANGVQDGTETGKDCGGGCPGCAYGMRCNAGTDCASGACMGGYCQIGVNCSNGAKDGTETDVDCGGLACQKCGLGKKCGGDSDCNSNRCIGGLCTPIAACSNGSKDGSETDVDCGGNDCYGCATGLQCSYGGDCASRVCTGYVCQAASCSDGVKNGDETDWDCGGPTCATRCWNGRSCLVASDCQDRVCTSGSCASPTCTDGVKNGQESDIDCGGYGGCPKCGTGASCSDGWRDCLSQVCSGSICQSPSCYDYVKNGNETDTDCGGGCPGCSTGRICVVGSDCASNFCWQGVCFDATCNNGLKDGMETDVDCGGSCPKCSDGKACWNSYDCSSGLCTNNACASTCADKVKDGSESDVDCGGSCSKCAVGKACSTASDCQNASCLAGRCQVASCTDGTKNGSESDIDCGGAACAPCATSKSCSATTDCATLYCSSSFCGNWPLKIQYKQGTYSTTATSHDNTISPNIRLVNNNTAGLDISPMKIRYWFTMDTPSPPEAVSCDASAGVMTCAGTTFSFQSIAPRPLADRYVELSFAPATIAAGQTAEIQFHFSKTDASVYDETNDRSWDAALTSYADYTRITLYYNGTLIWGSEP